LLLLCPCRNPERQTGTEDVSRRSSGSEKVPGSEVVPPGRARARDDHVT